MIFNKDLQVKHKYDLVICGGGMTGFAAAVSAARRGLKTCLIDKMGCLGGVATSCGVNHFLAGRKYYNESGKIVRKVGGLFDELTDTLISKGGAIEPETIDINNNPHGWYPRMVSGIPFDAEKLKILMEEMCLNAGVHLMYFTSLIDVDKQGNRIQSVILHNKSGLFAVETNAVVDATGDGDVAFLSGCKMVKGRDEDGLMTPASLELHVEHVDTKALLEYQNKYQSPKLVEIIQKLKEIGEWTFPYEIFICIQLTEPDVFMVNTIRQIGVDGTDGDSITKAMLEGRKENMKLFEIIRKHFPGFSNARIRKTAEMIGIRETRRIVGLYTVTTEDALMGKCFEDCVASTTYNFDLPDPKRPSYDPMMGNVANPHAEREYDTIQIPYRSLIPDLVENLIVAGRCVSVERNVLGPVRIMGPCMGMGQAAGLASVLTLRKDLSYSAVDVQELRSELIKDGCLLPKCN